MGGFIWEALEWGGGGLIWYGACNGGPGVVRNVPIPAPTTGARKASENNRARKCTRQNVSRRTCEPVCRLRGSRGCNYSRTRIKRHRIKRSVFKVPKITFDLY